MTLIRRRRRQLHTIIDVHRQLHGTCKECFAQHSTVTLLQCAFFFRACSSGAAGRLVQLTEAVGNNQVLQAASLLTSTSPTIMPAGHIKPVASYSPTTLGIRVPLLLGTQLQGSPVQGSFGGPLMNALAPQGVVGFRTSFTK